MENKKPYVEGTTLEKILLDGWSRGFEVQQTVDECNEMGHNVDTKLVEACWQVLDDHFATDEYLPDFK